MVGPGSGRKRKTTERSDRFIAKSSKSGTPTKKEITNELKDQTGVDVSTKTIQRQKKVLLGERNQRSHMLVRKRGSHV